MAITLEKKRALTADYHEKLGRSQALIVTNYTGLTVKQLETLRRELRGLDGEIVVVKNTLLGRALTESGLPAPEKLLTGPTAVAFCFGDLAAPTKALVRYARDTKILTIRGALIGQTVLDEAGAEALTDMPGRSELRAQAVGMLQAPLSGLVNVLAGTLRGFMNVLNARVEQMKEAA